MPQGSCYCLRLPPVGPTNQRPAFWVKMGESGIAVYLYTLNLPSLQFFSVWSSLVKPLRVRLRKVGGTYKVEKSHRWRHHRTHAAKLRASVTASSIERISKKNAELQPPPSARVVCRTSVETVRGCCHQSYLMTVQLRMESVD